VLLMMLMMMMMVDEFKTDLLQIVGMNFPF